jgi:hypothetical protein
MPTKNAAFQLIMSTKKPNTMELRKEPSQRNTFNNPAAMPPCAGASRTSAMMEKQRATTPIVAMPYKTTITT